jgi:indole-3-glycerol phosphate synthase
VTNRRLSHAIAEGERISLLFELSEPRGLGVASTIGAEGLVVHGSAFDRAETDLPVLAYGSSPEEAAAFGADAVVVLAGSEEDELAVLAERAANLGLELVVHATDEDDLARALDQLDPEIFLLASGPDHDDHESIDRLLELLPDVPAGKLAIALLSAASRADVEELERAGIDAVVVAGDLAELVGESMPEV